MSYFNEEQQEYLKDQAEKKLASLLNAEQKEKAAKALCETFWYLAIYFDASARIEKLQEELAKVGLAIQPINEKETK